MMRKVFIYKCEKNETIYTIKGIYKEIYIYISVRMENPDHKYHNHRFIVIDKKKYKRHESFFDKNGYLKIYCYPFLTNWDDSCIFPGTKFKRYYEEDV